MRIAPPPGASILPVLPAARNILAAADPTACHAAIGAALRQLEDGTGCTVRACELSMSLSGDVVIVWQGGDRHALPFDEKGTFGAWFARARKTPGELICLYGNAAGLTAAAGDGEIPLYVGLIADGMPETVDGMADAMSDIAAVAAQQLYRLRRDAEERLNRVRLDRMGCLQAELLRANVDVLWESGPDGLVHVARIFNGRQDMVRHLEGRRLEELRVAGGRRLAELVAVDRPVRNLRLDLPGEEILYISAVMVAGEGAKGTLSAGPDLTADRLCADASLLEIVLNARTREEQARREAESMLMGLRVLLAPAPFREKLEQLARQMARAADCDMVQVIQLRPGETPRLLSPPGLVSSEGAQALRRVLAAGEGRSVTILPATGEDSAVIRATLGAQGGDIALVTLPYAAERFYLLCRGRPSFGLREKGLAERFSLLAQQALALHDDQERMVHAAKLSALGQMSTSIAHELRQPLNTISIAAQNIAMLLEHGAVTDDLLREKTNRILQQVDRACRVMDRMRRFGRKSGGNYRPVPLLEVVRSVRSLMHAAADQAGIAIDIAVAEDDVVLADELEMEQVLVNLFQNALDAIMEGGSALGRRIRVWSCPDPGDPALMQLHVADSGPGFAPDVLAHALDAFFTTKKEDMGTGLGLSICHAILREHGGQLRIGNADGGGGQVTLFLRRPDVAGAKIVSIGRRRAPEPP